jgi:hypothetical protein
MLKPSTDLNIDALRHSSLKRFESRFLDIIQKYGSIGHDEGDEIDLRHDRIVVDRGFLKQLPTTDFGMLTVENVSVDEWDDIAARDELYKSEKECVRMVTDLTVLKDERKVGKGSAKSKTTAVVQIDDDTDLSDLCHLARFDLFASPAVKKRSVKSITKTEVVQKKENVTLPVPTKEHETVPVRENNNATEPVSTVENDAVVPFPTKENTADLVSKKENEIVLVPKKKNWEVSVEVESLPSAKQQKESPNNADTSPTSPSPLIPTQADEVTIPIEASSISAFDSFFADERCTQGSPQTVPFVMYKSPHLTHRSVWSSLAPHTVHVRFRRW